MSGRVVTDRITKSPAICGGDACIRGTRVSVWGLVAYRRLGMSNAEILRNVADLAKGFVAALGPPAKAETELVEVDA